MHFPQRRFCRAGEKLQDNDVEGLPKENDFDEVDLSRNSFSVNGFHSICEFCRLQSNLRILKLFKCGLCDRSAHLVASIALENPHNLEEMHLSHNLLTATGAVSIISAVEQSRGAAEALWLRLERNQIKNANEILVDLENRGSVCSFRNKRCKHRYCAERRKIHLPYFIHQNDGTDGPGRENKDNPSRSSRDWGWSNNYKDWSENYDQSYKARQISRSKSPPSQPIRLKERAVSPSMVHAKQRQREYREHGPSDRSPPHGRREVFYEPPAMKPEDVDTLDFHLNYRKRDVSSQSISQRITRTEGAEDWQHFPTEPPRESDEEPDSKTRADASGDDIANGYERSRSPNKRFPMHPRDLLEWENQLRQRERRLKEMERELRRCQKATMALVDVKQEHTGEQG